MSTTIDLISLAEPRVVSFTDVAIVLHPTDDVAIAKTNLAAGTVLQTSQAPRPAELSVKQLIPSGHKIAIRDVAVGQPVRRYGQVIGFAKRDIHIGDHVHVHNLGVADFERDYAFGVDVQPVQFVPQDQRRRFMGYRRADGRTGTRNYIAVISSVNCSAHTVRRIAHYFTGELLRDFPNVDGVIAIAHGFGCATRVGSEDYNLLQRTLAGIAAHPNVGAYILVGLGCEVNQISELVENYQLAAKEAPRIKRMTDVEEAWDSSSLRDGNGSLAALQPPSLTIQDTGGIRRTTQAGIEMIEELLPIVNQTNREAVPISELTVALQCGGSDGWSGVTANPVLGLACDEIVRQGGSVVLAETPEVYGAEHLLTRRAISRQVGEKLVRKIHWWEAHAAKHGVEIDNNPSHGNKAGGLTTIYEKSLGAVAKAGNTSLMDVYEYAEQITTRGFTFMDTPGYDPVGATGQVAGGCNLVVFTTGRGSCFGFKPAPSIKVCSNSTTFNRMPDDMDINAGKVIEGVPMQNVANELFDYMIEVASGKRQSKSEAQGVGEEEFQPWNLGGIL